MDHRAIVWCHSVLEQVRRTIWTLAQSKVAKANVQERRKRVQEVLGVVTSYSQQLATMKAQFQVCCVLRFRRFAVYMTNLLSLGLTAARL